MQASNNQASYQDLVQQEADQEQRVAKQNIAAQKLQVANAKRAGVETTVTPEGEETLKTNADGTPYYTPGFQGGAQIIKSPDGKESTAFAYRTPKGSTYNVDASGIRRREAAGGGAEYEFEITDETGASQIVRQPESASSPLFKIDEATGKRLVNTTDPNTGSVTSREIGYDPNAAAKAAINRQKQAWETRKGALTFQAESIKAQQDIDDLTLKPVKEKLSAAEKAFEELNKGRRYEQRADGLYAVEKIGDEDFPSQVTDENEKIKAQAWLENSKQVEQALNASKAEYSPLKSKIDTAELERRKLAKQLIEEGHRAQVLERDLAKKAKEGVRIWESDFEKRLDDLQKDPRFTGAITEGALADEGNPLADANNWPELPETNRLMVDLLQNTPAAYKTAAPYRPEMPGEAALPGIGGQLPLNLLLEQMPIAPKKPDGTPDVVGAAQVFGIKNPELYSAGADPDGNGTPIIRSDTGTPVARVAPDGKSLRITPEALSTDDARSIIANANEKTAPIFAQSSTEPFTASERRNYFQTALQTVGSRDDKAMQAAGTHIQGIRKQFRDGKLSAQDANFLLTKLHGVEGKTFAAEDANKELAQYVAASKIESNQWTGPNSNPVTRKAVVDRFMDTYAQKAQGSLLYDGKRLEQLRTELRDKHAPQSGFIKRNIEGTLSTVTGGLYDSPEESFMEDTPKMLLGSVLGLLGNVAVRTDVVGILEYLDPSVKEQLALSKESTDDWNKNAMGFFRRVQADPAFQAEVNAVKDWADKAEPGDDVPEDLANSLSRLTFENYHGFSKDDQKATDNNTTQETFDPNKDTVLQQRLQRYLTTRNPDDFEAFSQMLTMDGKSRALADRQQKYITKPRAATDEEVMERAEKLGGVKLTQGQAAALRNAATTKPTTVAQYEALKKQVEGITKLTGNDAELALDLFTGESTTEQNSLMGYVRGGMSAPAQEIITEAASWAIGAGVSKVAAGSIKGAVKGSVAAARKASTAGYFADKAAKLVNDYERAGMFTARFGAPLSKAQRASNAAVAGGKAVAVQSVDEGLQEGIMAAGEPGSTFKQVVEQAGQGAAAGILMTGGMTALALPFEFRSEARAAKAYEVAKQEALTKFNKHLETIPGAKPLSPDDYDAAIALYGSNEAKLHMEQLAPVQAELQAATAELASVMATPEGRAIDQQDNVGKRSAQIEKQLAEINTRLGDPTATNRQITPEEQTLQQELTELQSAAVGPRLTRPDQIAEARRKVYEARQKFIPIMQQTVLRETMAVNAVAELQGLPAEQRTLYTAIAKARLGQAEYTREEADALTKLSGPQAVRWTAAPSASATSGLAPEVISLPQGRVRMVPGSVPIIPDSLLLDIAENAPILGEMLATSGTREAQVQQQAAQTLQRVADIEANIEAFRQANPTLAPAIKAARLPEGSSGMQMNTDTQEIEYDAERMAADLANIPPEQRQARLETLLDEEIRHRADEQAALSIFQALIKALSPPLQQVLLKGYGTDLTSLTVAQINGINQVLGADSPLATTTPDARQTIYNQWKDRYYARLAGEFTAEQTALIKEAYGSTYDALPAQVKVREGIRMLSQIKRSKFGKITEAIWKHVKATVDALKSLLTNPPPQLARHLALMEKVLEEYGYDAPNENVIQPDLPIQTNPGPVNDPNPPAPKDNAAPNIELPVQENPAQPNPAPKVPLVPLEIRVNVGPKEWRTVEFQTEADAKAFNLAELVEKEKSAPDIATSKQLNKQINQIIDEIRPDLTTTNDQIKEKVAEYKTVILEKAAKTKAGTVAKPERFERFQTKAANTRYTSDPIRNALPEGVIDIIDELRGTGFGTPGSNATWNDYWTQHAAARNQLLTRPKRSKSLPKDQVTLADINALGIPKLVATGEFDETNAAAMLAWIHENVIGRPIHLGTNIDAWNLTNTTADEGTDLSATADLLAESRGQAGGETGNELFGEVWDAVVQRIKYAKGEIQSAESVMEQGEKETVELEQRQSEVRDRFLANLPKEPTESTQSLTDAVNDPAMEPGASISINGIQFEVVDLDVIEESLTLFSEQTGNVTLVMGMNLPNVEITAKPIAQPAAEQTEQQEAKPIFKPEKRRFQPTVAEQTNILDQDRLVQTGGIIDVTPPTTSKGLTAKQYGGASRAEIKDAVWQMYLESYKGLGYQHENADQMLDDGDSVIYEVTYRDGQPVAFISFKPTAWGNKIVMAGQNNTITGAGVAVAYIKKLNQPGWYAELSGRPADLAKKRQYATVPPTEVEAILGKEITPDPDGISYSREINLLGPRTSAMYGLPWRKQIPSRIASTSSASALPSATPPTPSSEKASATTSTPSASPDSSTELPPQSQTQPPSSPTNAQPATQPTPSASKATEPAQPPAKASRLFSDPEVKTAKPAGKRLIELPQGEVDTQTSEEQEAADEPEGVQFTPAMIQQAISMAFGPLDPSVKIQPFSSKDFPTPRPYMVRGRTLIVKLDQGGLHAAMPHLALPILAGESKPAGNFIGVAGDKRAWVSKINRHINTVMPDLDEQTDIYIEPYGGALTYLQNLDVLAKTEKPVFIASAVEFEPDRNRVYSAIKNGDPQEMLDMRKQLQNSDRQPNTQAGASLKALLNNPGNSWKKGEIIASFEKLTKLLRRPNVHILDMRDTDVFDLVIQHAKNGTRVTFIDDSNYVNLPWENTPTKYAWERAAKNPYILSKRKIPAWQAVLDAGGTVLATNHMDFVMTPRLMEQFGNLGVWNSYPHPSAMANDQGIKHPSGANGRIVPAMRAEFIALLNADLEVPAASSPKYASVQNDRRIWTPRQTAPTAEEMVAMTMRDPSWIELTGFADPLNDPDATVDLKLSSSLPAAPIGTETLTAEAATLPYRDFMHKYHAESKPYSAGIVHDLARLDNLDPSEYDSWDQVLDNPASRAHVQSMIAAPTLPPILVTGLPTDSMRQQVNDGHHRYVASLYRGADTIPVAYDTETLARLWKDQHPESTESIRSLVQQAPSLPSLPAAPVEPGFYSALAESVRAKMPARTNPANVIGIIKNAGLKAEEIKWSGIMPWLEGRPQNEPVTKDEVLEYLSNEGAIRFQVTKLGDMSNRFTYKPSERVGSGFDVIDPRGNFTVWEETEDGAREAVSNMNAGWDRGGQGQAPTSARNIQWTTPGGTNHREVVVSMPTYPERFKQWAEAKGIDNIAEAEEAFIKQYGRGPAEQFGSPNNPNDKTHYGDLNALAWFRANDRDGGKGLFIDELQSKWHQMGREKGYAGDSKGKMASAKQRANGLWEAIDERGLPISTPAWNGTAKTEQEAIDKGNQVLQRLVGPDAAVADAPYRTTWPLMLFKRALRDAVEDGKEWIGWTVGETQAERYDLSKQVDEVRVTIKADKNYVVHALKDGTILMQDQDVPASKLPEVVGKDLAKRIIAEATTPAPSNATDYNAWQHYSGIDLKVGGEGMKAFYDSILPKEIGKYVKQWGGKVEKGGVKTDGYASPPTWEPFTESDWDNFSGAEEFRNGDQPMIGTTEMEVGKDKEKFVVIIGPDGIELVNEEGESFPIAKQSFPGSQGPGQWQSAKTAKRVVSEAWVDPNHPMWNDLQDANNLKTEIYPLSGTQPIWKVEITDSMREGVQKGQALFAAPVAQRVAARQTAAKIKTAFDAVFPHVDLKDRGDQISVLAGDARWDKYGGNIKTIPGGDDYTGIALRVYADDTPFVRIDEMNVASNQRGKGFGIKMLEAIQKGGVPVYHSMDMSGGFWEHVKATRPELFNRSMPAAPARAYESMDFSPPFKTSFGDILSYHWMSRPQGQFEVSDWTQARTNPQTGRKIVHHFKVRRDDEISTVSLETAMGQLTEQDRAKVRRMIRTEQEKRWDAENGQMTLFAAPAARITSKMDADYLAAVEAGDMDTAQRMVDEALFESKPDNVKPESINRIIDAVKTKPGDSLIVIGQKPEGSQFRGYAAFRYKKQGNVFVGQSLGSIKSGAGTQAMARAAKQAIAENSVLAISPTPDSESFYLSLGGVFGSVESFPGRIGFTGKALSDLAAKSADPVTRDKQGNVIPLSQRFNPQSDSILYAAPAVTTPDKATIAKLEREPKVTRYRAMAMIDGKLYPPMSTSLGKDRRPPEPIGEWMQAEERPDLVPTTGPNAGKFRLKGPTGKDVWALYAPYFHSSQNPLNDQFSAAYSKPLVTVEIEIPAKDDYQAPGSKRAAGDHRWAGGRIVSLSRYAKIKRVVPDSEVARLIRDTIPEGTNIPDNVVTPSLRKELEKIGVPIQTTGIVTTLPAAPVDISFASGIDKSVDLEGAVRAKAPMGTTAQVMKKNPGFAKVFTDVMKEGIPVFIDSGAFSELTAGLTVDFPSVFEQYNRVAADPESNKHLSVVAPDKVGDQAESLKRLIQYQTAVQNLINKGVRVIVPVQSGELDMATYLERAGIDPSKVAIGIPANKKGYPRQLLRQHIADANIKDVHILGMSAANKDATQLADAMRESGVTKVTMDANRIRSAAGRAIKKLDPDSEEQRRNLDETLHDTYDAFWDYPEAVQRKYITDSGVYSPEEAQTIDINEAVMAIEELSRGTYMNQWLTKQEGLEKIVTENVRTEQIANFLANDQRTDRPAGDQQMNLFAAPVEPRQNPEYQAAVQSGDIPAETPIYGPENRADLSRKFGIPSSLNGPSSRVLVFWDERNDKMGAVVVLPERTAPVKPVSEQEMNERRYKALLESYEKGNPVLPELQRLETIMASSLPAAPVAKEYTTEQARQMLAGTRMISTRSALEALGQYPEYLDAVASQILAKRDKLLQGKLTVRDVAKAYILTQGSIGSDARPTATIMPDIRTAGLNQNSGLDPLTLFQAPDGSIRPEEITAWWLGTPLGQEALNDLEQGKVNQKAFEQLATVKRSFGKDNFKLNSVTGRNRKEGFQWLEAPDKGQFSLTNVEALTQAINDTKGDPQKLERTLLKINGISHSKKGFIGHMLGMGSMPTTDAVEYNFWLTGQGEGRIANLPKVVGQTLKALKENQSSLNEEVYRRISTRIKQLGKELGKKHSIDPDVLPHILHHWIWDKAKGIQTTHRGMYQAMSLYAAPAARTAAADIDFVGIQPALLINNKPYLGVKGMWHGDLIGHWVQREIYTPQQRRDDPSGIKAVEFGYNKAMDDTQYGFGDFGFYDQLTGQFLDRTQAAEAVKATGLRIPQRSWVATQNEMDSSDIELIARLNRSEASSLPAAPATAESPDITALESYRNRSYLGQIESELWGLDPEWNRKVDVNPDTAELEWVNPELPSIEVQRLISEYNQIVAKVGPLPKSGYFQPTELLPAPAEQLRLNAAPVVGESPNVTAALESMPPMWRDVLQQSMRGESIPSMAKRMGISEVGVSNILRNAQGRLTALTKAADGTLKPTVRLEDGQMKYTAGRPDLAMGAMPNYNAVDRERATPMEVTHAEMNEYANRLFEIDAQQAEKLITHWLDTQNINTTGMDPDLVRIVTDATGRDAKEMLMVAASKMLVTRKSLTGGDPVQIARLIDSYRRTGTEQARALGMRRDPHMTPAERHAMFISEALLTPPQSIRLQIEKNPGNREMLLAKWAARSQEIKKGLKAKGIDIDASFKALNERQQAARDTIPEALREPLSREARPEQILAKTILEGSTPREAAEAAGMSIDAARASLRGMRSRIGNVLAAIKRQLLPAAPADQNGQNNQQPELLPPDTIFDTPDKPAVDTKQTRRLKKLRSEPLPSDAINLDSPIATARATQEISTQKARKLDALTEFWRASILTGPQTHAVNVASSSLYGAYEATLKRLATATLADTARLFGMRPDAASLADLPAVLSAVFPSIQSAFKDAIRAWNSNTRVFDAVARNDDLMGKPAIGNEVYEPALKGALGTVMRGMSFRLMLLADQFILSFFSRIEVAAQARQIARAENLTGKALADRMTVLLQPGSQAWLRSLDQGLKITFQTDIGTGERAIDSLDGLAKAINSAKRGNYGETLKAMSMFIFPFVNTPTNIFKQGMTIAPTGAFLAIIDAARALNQSRKGNKEQARRLYSAARGFDDLVNQTIAWGGMIALYSLVNPDEDDNEALPFITGSLPWRATSQGQREIAYRTAPPQSVRIGGQWFSYRRLDPFATALAFAVDTLREINTGTSWEEIYPKIGVQMLNNLQDKTFMTGISDLMNAIQDPGRFGAKWATNIATGFVPNIIRQPLRNTDNVFRETDLPNDLGLVETIGARIGMGIYAPAFTMPKVDVWGRDNKKNTGLGSPASDALYRILTPIDTQDSESADPLDVALLRWNMMNPDDTFDMTAPRREVKRTLGGDPKSVSLDDEAYHRMIATAGQKARKAIGDRYNGRDLSIDDVENIKKVVQSFQSQERERAFRENYRP